MWRWVCDQHTCRNHRPHTGGDDRANDRSNQRQQCDDCPHKRPGNRSDRCRASDKCGTCDKCRE